MEEYLMKVDVGQLNELVSSMESRIVGLEADIKLYESIRETNHPDYLMQRRELIAYRRFREGLYAAFPEIKPNSEQTSP